MELNSGNGCGISRRAVREIRAMLICDLLGALYGAVAGGLAQNVSFIVGMKALLLIAALFYTSAGLCALLKTRQSMPEAVVAGPPIGA